MSDNARASLFWLVMFVGFAVMTWVTYANSEPLERHSSGEGRSWSPQMGKIIALMTTVLALAAFHAKAAPAEKLPLMTMGSSSWSCRDKSVLHRYIVDNETNLSDAIVLERSYGCRLLRVEEGPFALLQNTARIDRFCQIEPIGSHDPTWVLCTELRPTDGKED